MGEEYEVSRRGRSLLTKEYHHSKMNVVIERGLKRIWESKTGTPYSARIIKDVYLALKSLEIVYRANRAAVEGLADRNGHRRKVVGDGKGVSWGGAWTKGKGCECKPTKNMFFLSDLLKFCMKEKKNITDFFPDTTVFTIRKIALRGNNNCSRPRRPLSSHNVVCSENHLFIVGIGPIRNKEL